jgi:hypothetical protein
MKNPSHPGRLVKKIARFGSDRRLKLRAKLDAVYFHL